MMTQYEQEGLRYYKHKYFLPQYQRLYNYQVDKKGRFIRKESDMNTYRYEMVKNDSTFILKLIAQVHDNYKIQVLPKNSNNIKDGLIQYPQNYTGIHTLVFENEMKNPKIGEAVDLSHYDWIEAHKAKKNKWILVDIDNYLNGNSYFIGHCSLEEHKKRIKINIIEQDVTEGSTDEELAEVMKNEPLEITNTINKKMRTLKEIEGLKKQKEEAEEGEEGVSQEKFNKMSIEEILNKPDTPRKYAPGELARPAFKVSKKKQNIQKSKSQKSSKGKKWAKR